MTKFPEEVFKIKNGEKKKCLNLGSYKKGKDFIFQISFVAFIVGLTAAKDMGIDYVFTCGRRPQIDSGSNEC
jgi:hypothetical protein